jgi:hypothetical protein
MKAGGVELGVEDLVGEVVAEVGGAGFGPEDLATEVEADGEVEPGPVGEQADGQAELGLRDTREGDGRARDGVGVALA